MTAGPVERPVITITFAGPDSANAVVDPGKVTAGQLYLAAWLLEAQAREIRQGQLIQAAQERAATALVAAGIRNGGRG